jgi:hypothetical protein
MKKIIFLTAMTLILINCGSASKLTHKKLNGTWKNNIMTVSIDFNKRTYKGVALGKEFNRKLKLVKEEPDTVFFTTDGTKIVCQINDDNNIILTKEGGIPVAFKRLK